MGTPQTCDHACPLGRPEAGTPAPEEEQPGRHAAFVAMGFKPIETGVEGIRAYEIPAAAGIIARDPAITFFDEEITGQKPSPRERLDAALEDFGRALVDITGSIGRAWEIIREMKGELLALEGPCHDEPGEPTEGHR